MLIKDIFTKRQDKQPNFDAYAKPIDPLMDIGELKLHRMINGIDEISVPIDRNAVGILQISYKGKAGGILSIAEDTSGENWTIPQVQGGHSKKSYRIATGLRWENLLANEVEECSRHSNAKVRRILMPHYLEIENIVEAASKNVELRYRAIACTLKMEWSDEEKLWIADVPKLSTPL